MRLTQLAHDILDRHVGPGDVVIDATAGNGHDTLFLASLVGETGHVYAFDTQAIALASTQARLTQYSILCTNNSDHAAVKRCAIEHAADEQISFARVTLVHANHANMLDHVRKPHRGRVAAVAFNLGYLPGQRLAKAKPDPNLSMPALEYSTEKEANNNVARQGSEKRPYTEGATQPKSTIAALRQALSVVRSGGVITLIAYVGHEGGQQEVDAIKDVMAENSAGDVNWQELARNQKDVNSPRLFVAKVGG